MGKDSGWRVRVLICMGNIWEYVDGGFSVLGTAMDVNLFVDLLPAVVLCVAVDG